MTILKINLRNPFDDDVCPECMGNPRCECDTCDGDGEFEYDGHFYDCKTCDGEGKITCHACNGEGTLEAYEAESERVRIITLIEARYGKYQTNIHDYWFGKTNV